MAFSHLVVFMVALAAVTAKEAKFTGCSGVRGHCDVSSVRITPCEVKGNKCLFYQGTNVSMAFDFKPSFAATKLKTQVSWNDNPLAELNEDACLLTACPSVADTTQALNFVLPISIKMPRGMYPIKWKVWNADNPDVDICCFKTIIVIDKQKN